MREKEISKKKLKVVDELINLIKSSRTLVIVAIKNLPSSQFQLIKKKLEKDDVIKVKKKSVINRVIDSIEKGTIKNLKKYLKEDQALIFSNLEPFELSLILSKNKSYGKAKIGQKVEEEVVIESGPTELVPGPIISELTSLGLKFSIEDGKINIREKKTILKANEVVNEAQASIMNKLEIKPIAVGLEPVIAYDSKEDKIYEDIKINQEETLKELKEKVIRALAFAIKLEYPCKETIKFLLRKAYSEERVLEKFLRQENLNQQNVQGG